MKKLLLIISLVLIGFVANAQIQKPDTLQLSPKEHLISVLNGVLLEIWNHI